MSYYRSRRSYCSAPSCRCESPCDAYYGDEDEERECEGPHDDCEGCDSCTDSASTFRFRIARKARGSILPGDLITVETGFWYQKNGGPRLGYFKNERITGYGPGHGPSKMGTGNWSRRGGFSENHPEHAAFVNARNELRQQAYAVQREELDVETWTVALVAFEATFGLSWSVDDFGGTMTEETVLAKRQSAIDARLERERKAAEKRALRLAREGDTIEYEGATWTVDKTWSKPHYFSDMEYNGQLCDAEVRSYASITNTETGETRQVRT